MKLSRQTILVTGGAGFIGSHLVESLTKNNRVIIYDNFSSPVVSLRYLGHLGNVSVIKGDIRDFKKLSKAMADVDLVIAMAAAHLRLSLSDPIVVHNVNTTGALTTLEAAYRNHIKKFIYLSSSEVYGTAKADLMNENHKKNPVTVYGLSKYIGEQYTNLYHKQHHVPTVIIRPFNTYGPRSHCEGIYGEVIPRFVIWALAGKQPVMFGDGKQTRDFTYVTDTVEGIIKSIYSETCIGQEVNIACGKEVSIEELAQTICSLTHLPFQPIFKPARPHDVSRHAADITKARNLLSFAPLVSLKQGLTAYIDWVKKTIKNPQDLARTIPDTNW